MELVRTRAGRIEYLEQYIHIEEIEEKICAVVIETEAMYRLVRVMAEKI